MTSGGTLHTPATGLALDAELKLVISATASAGRPGAVRYEPTTHDRIIDGSHSDAVVRAGRANFCNIATAQVLCACSWGLYQIMGYNLYSQGYTAGIALYLAQAGIQDAALARFLAADGLADMTWRTLASDDDARRNFIARYNGPGNPEAYWHLMTVAAKSCGLEIG